MSPTRIFLNSGSSVVVLEDFAEVTEKIENAKQGYMQTVVFTDKEARTPDRRVMLVADHVDYCKPERVSI